MRLRICVPGKARRRVIAALWRGGATPPGAKRRGAASKVLVRQDTASMAGNALDSLDHHGLQRCIFFEWRARAGRHIADLVDHFHALNDLAEDRVSPTCL